MTGTERVALVTGGAQGIGRSIARRFADDGAGVLILDLDGDLVAKTAQELSSGGRRVIGMAGDVSKRQDVRAAVQRCVDEFGRLDVMVAHAGIADAEPLLEIDDESWQRIMAVNVTGVFLCTQEAGRVMKEQGQGAVIVTASTNAFQVESNLAHYNTSKGAVVAFIRSAGIDLAQYGIRVNGVAPGVVRTRIAAWVTEDPVRGPEYLKNIPLHRFGEPDDIANVVYFLASDAASYITGQTIVADGGQTLGILVEAPEEPLPGSGRSDTPSSVGAS